MKSLPLADQITLATVRLNASIGGSKRRLGTGFFFQMGTVGNMPLSLVVTNKHVIEGAESVTFHTSHADDAGFPILGSNQDVDVSGAVMAQITVDHPDPDVDLCGVITWPLIALARREGKKLSHRHLNESLIVSAEELKSLSAIEDVIFVGYPSGLWDNHNNRPIARRGITATHARLEYQGRAEFLVDAPVFEGSSGSPVFLYRPEVHLQREEFVIVNKPRLLGVLTEAPTHTAKALVSNAFALTEEGVSAEFKLPLNLGLVQQVRRVLELRIPAEELGDRIKREISPAVEGDGTA